MLDRSVFLYLRWNSLFFYFPECSDIGLAAKEKDKEKRKKLIIFISVFCFLEEKMRENGFLTLFARSSDDLFVFWFFLFSGRIFLVSNQLVTEKTEKAKKQNVMIVLVSVFPLSL